MKTKHFVALYLGVVPLLAAAAVYFAGEIYRKKWDDNINNKKTGFAVLHKKYCEAQARLSDKPRMGQIFGFAKTELDRLVAAQTPPLFRAGLEDQARKRNFRFTSNAPSPVHDSKFLNKPWKASTFTVEFIAGSDAAGGFLTEVLDRFKLATVLKVVGRAVGDDKGGPAAWSIQFELNHQ